MLIGMGGNSSTLCATILAYKHNILWHTKDGIQQPNHIGSVLRASTANIGTEPGTGKEVHVLTSDVLPMVHHNDLVLGDWDISGLSMDKAIDHARVLDYDLQHQVAPYLALLGRPLPTIYYPDFIVANHEAQVDNLIARMDKQVHLDHIRADIQRFKEENGLDCVVVFWTTNTERYSDIIPGVNDTADNVLASIRTSQSEMLLLTIFAVASILEGMPFVNDVPQNTFVPPPFHMVCVPSHHGYHIHDITSIPHAAVSTSPFVSYGSHCIALHPRIPLHLHIAA